MPPVDPWAHTYGGGGQDSFSPVTVADNGDIIAAGYTDSTDGDFPATHGQDNDDAMLARFTPTGDLIWAHTYGGTNDEGFYSLAVADNGDIIAIGATSSADGDFPSAHGVDNFDAVIARFTPTGDLIWAHTLGGPDREFFESVTIADNGDIVTAGYTYSSEGDFPTTHGDDNFDAVIARFTPTGDLIWAHTLGGSGLDYFSSVAVTDNGDIVTAGYTMSKDGDFPMAHEEKADALIARFTPTGDLIWAHTLGGSGEDYFQALVVADNGDIIVTGAAMSADGDFPATHGADNRDALIARFTPTGDLIWAHTFGGTKDDYFVSATGADNGDIITAGYTYSTDGDFPSTHGEEQRDALIARFTSTGDLVWAHSYGGNNNDYFDSVIGAGNGDIIVTGYSDSTDGDFPATHGADNRDALIARFTEKGTLT
jgi:uncharacterized delta-60 repeat protein